MEALDLCLSCKGCTNDCPVNVDMPTLQGGVPLPPLEAPPAPAPRVRVRADRPGRRASPRARPGSSNFLTQTPPFAQAFKAAAGMTQERAVPTFAPLTLQEWFKRRGGTTNPDGRKVVLCPDTFNNHLHTDVGVAAVEAIEAAGWQVVMPRGTRLLRPAAVRLRLPRPRRALPPPQPRAAAGVVSARASRSSGSSRAASPSSRTSSAKLLPNDDDAKRLATSIFHFAEFFAEFDIEPPPLARKAFVWGHCHHKATGGIDPEVELLKKMGVEVETLKAGCCGLAGSWGFEAGHHELSMQCGEQGLLPKVRELDCRDARRRRRLLVQDADRAGGDGPPGAPRRAGPQARARARRRRAARPEAGAALLRNEAEGAERTPCSPRRGGGGGARGSRYTAAAPGAVAQLVRALHS